MDSTLAGEKRMLQISELDEFHNEAYENARIYKENTKAWHDKHMSGKNSRRDNRSSCLIPDSNSFPEN